MQIFSVTRLKMAIIDTYNLPGVVRRAHPPTIRFECRGSGNVRQAWGTLIQLVVRSFASLTEGSIEDAARDGPCVHGKGYPGFVVKRREEPLENRWRRSKPRPLAMLRTFPC